MKAKIKRFFESTGFTKAQLITVFLCYFLCFALFLGVVVIWDPMSKSLSEQTIAVDGTTPTGPTNIDGSWITEGRYSIEWFKNAQSVEIDGTTYQPGTEQNPYIIDSAEDLAGLSWLVYTKGQADNPLVSGTDYSGNNIFQRKYFKQTENIDLSAYYWQPIGIYYTREGTSRSNYFSGNYDGGNHTVSGIFTPAGSDKGYSYQGLFGYVYSQSSSNRATIQNIGVIDSNFQGYNCIGGIIGGSNSFLNLSNCYFSGNITGTSYTGGIVGSVSTSSMGSVTISNCYNLGNVIGTTYYTAGIVGRSSSSTISLTYCYNSGYIEGGAYVAGIVGYSDPTKVTFCYNSGNIEGENYVGGIVGSSNSSATLIYNSYNIGSIVGSGMYIGGIIGQARSVEITNNFNSGNVSSNSTSDTAYIGGIAGRLYGSNRILMRYNYSFGAISSVNASATNIGNIIGADDTSGSGGVYITNNFYGANCNISTGNGIYSDTLTMDTPKTESWYTDSSNWEPNLLWNFDENWQISSSVNDGYPVLYYQEVPIDWWTNEGNYSIEWYNNSDTTTYGDGSASNPYIIDSAEDLAGLSYLVYTKGQEDNPLVSGTDYSGNYIFQGKYFKQTVDIDLSAHVWQPIGISYDRSGNIVQNYFAGNYDGQGFTVSEISTPEGQTDAYSNQGLFGYCDLSDSNQTYEIKNVNIVNSNIKGYNYVGGVVGRCGNADLYLINCSNFGSVSGNQYVGGIIGRSYRPILNCYNGGEIFGNTYVGGISGDASQIYKCYNIGKVTGTASVGGVIGRGTAKYCYNQGEVSGTTYVGGIVGGNAQDSSFASRCYNTGIITGNDYVAGIVGYSYSFDGTYDAGDVIAYNINIGQIQGVTNVGQIASACEGTQLIKNYFNTGSSADTVDGATYDTNSENYLYDEAWLYENLFWDIGFTYKISQDAYPTFRTEEEKNSWLNESLVEINTNWEGLGTIDSPYKISSAEDLAGLAVAVNTGMIGDEALEYSNVQTPIGIQAQVYFQGIYFEQTADIDLSSHYWESIGSINDELTEMLSFGGNYNGNNYKISGLKTVEKIYTYQSNGLFSSIIGTSTQKAEIKNINFDKTNYVASPTMFSGILAGMSFDAQINNCKFEGNIFIPHEYAEPYIFGGVVGSYAVDSIVSDCINYCDIYSDFSADAICGIVGVVASFSSDGVAKIENCVNYGNFSGAGNMIGICSGVMMGEISGCKNYGNITSYDIKMSPDRSDELVCGIVSTVENGEIKNCENYGNLTTYHSEVTDKVLYIAGIAYSISSSSLTNCNNYGEVVVANSNESSQIMPSGIVGSMQQSTVDSCNNYGLVNGVYSSGIVSCVNGVSTIINCNNFGSIKATYGSAGIAFLIANGTTIENCGSFGTLETLIEGSMSMGIAYLPVQDASVETDQYFIRNCLVDVKVTFNQDQTLFGGIMGMAYGESSGTNVSPYIDNCFVKAELSLPEVLTLTSFDVIDAINGLYPDSSFTADINCYGVITGNGIDPVKHISGLTTGMEGNFVYLDGFYDDMPVPIKTDGTNFFHMHDFGSTTGIVEKINREVPESKSLLKEPVIVNSVYQSFAGCVELDYSLGLIEGKNYKLDYIVGEKSYSVSNQCFAGDSSDNSIVSGSLTIGNMGSHANIFTYNGYVYMIIIVQDAVYDSSSGSFVYSQGKSLLLITSTTETAPQIECTFIGITLID